MSLTREEVAYHEAGHFVATHLLSPTTIQGEVSTRPDEEAESLGRVLSEDNWMEGEELAEATVISLFAGHEAQKLVNPAADLGYASSDTERALDILEALGEADQESAWRAKAHAFVMEHRDAIAALARALLEHEVLDSVEAQFVVGIEQGEVTAEDLARYRTFRDRPTTASTWETGEGGASGAPSTHE